MKLTFDTKSFSKQLRQKRLIERNVDMETIAGELNISKSTLSRCENGKTPQLVTYALLCEWLEIPMNQFFKKGKIK
jgi:transcriptional regulator with XRE-family HTH domain